MTSAGSATDNSAVFWARTTKPFIGTLTIQPANDPNRIRRLLVRSNPKAGQTIKKLVTGLQANTTYTYTFSTLPLPFQQQSIGLTGTIKTAPTASTVAPVRFGFSSCADGKYAPFYALADIPEQKLDFFILQGDAVYEDASKQSKAAPPPFNPASPNTVDTAALQQSVDAYQRKFLENISPNSNQSPGNGNLGVVYRSTGLYAAYDNHETADTALEAGGAPKNAIQVASWPAVDGSKTPNGSAIKGGQIFREGVDLSAANLVNRTGTFLNQRPEHKALIETWFQNMPERNRGLITSSDPRENGIQQLYYAQQWGKHAVLINVDDRTFRDAKITALKTKRDSNGNIEKISEDDVTDASIDGETSKGRTILGSKQLEWLKQTLSNAQANGTTWKFVSTSSPMDITGLPGDDNYPEEGGLSVDAKSWWGNYRAERNELLKYIADNKITNVVLLSGDDHEGRVNELSYAPDGQIDNLSGYTTVPHAFSVVTSPIGASRPDGFVKAAANAADGLTGIADRYATAFTQAGLDPVGLNRAFPGLTTLKRNGIQGYAADVKNPKLIDFWTPETFNYGLIDVDSTGTLTVSMRGIPPTTVDSFPSTAPAPVGEILSFSLTPALA